MKLLEGSDTKLEFAVTEKIYENWCFTGVENPINLTQYDKVILTMKYLDWIVEYEGTVSEQENSHVFFDIFSEATAWKSWKVVADIWGIKWGAKKVRLNSLTLDGEILHSIKIPEWIVND